MRGASVPARVFDGRSAASRPVSLSVSAGWLRLEAEDGALLREEPLAAVRISEPLGRTPRQLVFADGAVVEVADGAALTAALARAGRRPATVERLQESWAAAIGALVATVVLAAGAFGWGVPLAARAIAAVAPAGLERKLGDGALQLLELQLLRPSDLDPERQDAVVARLKQRLRAGAPGVHARILIRAHGGPGSGVNAFALPGGTIVLLDELVERTGGDDRLLAVVGHELGHQVRHHSTQRLVQAAGLAGLATLVWGDASAVAANVPVALALFDYSREAEQEADGDALRFLEAVGLGPRPLFDAFCLLEAAGKEAGTGAIPGFLLTHPRMEERLARVRQAAAATWTCPEAARGAQKAVDGGEPCDDDEEDAPGLEASPGAGGQAPR